MAALLLVSGVVTMLLWPERETTAQRNLQLPGTKKLLAPNLISEKIVAPSATPEVVINDSVAMPEVPPSEEAPSDVFAPTTSAAKDEMPGDDVAAVDPNTTIAPLGHSGTYILQVSSESDEASAQASALKLREHGHSAFVVRAQNEGRETTWRVRIGPFDYQRDAKKYRALLEDKEALTSYVVRTSDEL